MGQEDAFPLTTGLRLDDKGLPSASPSRLAIVLFEKMIISRKDECFGYEVVVLRKGDLHFSHVLCKVVLSGQGIHAGEMIYFLMRLHFAEGIDADGSVDPFYVPALQIFLHYDVVVEVPADLLDDLVLSVDQSDGDRSTSAFVRLGLVFYHG